MTEITFISLKKEHFSLLLKWLEAPHVKNWWDQDINYTMELVEEKFGKHIHGTAISNNPSNKTYAYIVSLNKEMIGYIQCYNARSFAHENNLDLASTPGHICGIDLFIGESNLLHKGYGTKILNEFEKQILAPHFNWCLIDPATDNLSAIKAFKKAGFKIFEQFQTTSNTWMIKELEHKTTIIYLTGKPGVGKYTIAKELAARHGFIICDNQLVNNPIFELLQYDGHMKIPKFAWDSIAVIRTEIFNFLTKIPENNYVLTNVLEENDGDRALYNQVKNMAKARNSLFIPVKLSVDQKEHLKRITQISRRERWKSINPQDVYAETPSLVIAHPNLLELDITDTNPIEAAKIIMDHIKNCME